MRLSSGQTVVDRFAEQVRSFPDSAAVICGGTRLSYAELDARANCVASALRAREVGLESRVGLCLERSVDLPVGILGITKAGAAYVAMDPGYPADRLRLLVEDSGAVGVIGERGLDAGWNVPSLTVDELSASAAPQPPVPAGPGNALYVVYTSGSTGRPKAVVMEHGPTARLMRWAVRRYRLDGPVLQYFPITSDVCGYEFFSTWWAGGCVVMAEEADRFDVARLSRLIHRHQIGTILLPGAVLLDLARHAGDSSDEVASVGEIITTGDRLRVTDELRRMCLRQQGPTLDNQWGSTEVNVVTALRLTAPADAWPDAPSIGSPVSGGRIYVLDRHLQQVPINVPGELYVGGAQLARGYLGRPDLTAAAFLPDPYTDTPGGRMYRTGDLGRWRPDRTLEFLGRVDFQLKVHGYRVEPGEVESVLREHRAVGRAAVVGHQTGTGLRLVAYVAPDAASSALPDPLELREFLRRHLPDHMVPAAVVTLPTLPTTPTGKVDRTALPAPDVTEQPVRAEPRNDTERQIIDIWQKVLRRSPIGPHEDFFSLGGHSLLCVQVVARINRAFDVDLPLRAMFTHRTVAEFAEVVANAQRSRQPVLARQPRSSSRLLSFAQQRLWFLEQLQPGMTAYLLPRTFRLQGPLDSEALHRAFTTVLTRHAALRSHFEEVDIEPVVVIDLPERIPLEMVDVSGEPNPLRATQVLVRGRADTPFDMAPGPLMRAVLVRLAPDDHVLHMVIHHAVFDGLSQQILSHELSVAYQAHRAGSAVDLPELAIEYTDYAAWQRELLASDLSTEQVRYWRAKLGGAPAVLELPTDHPRPPIPSYGGAAVPFDVPGEVATRLREIANSRQATTFMVTLAAFQVLLGRYAQTDDVVVGCPVAGRSEPELEALVGFFVNSLALRTRVSGTQPFTELLDQVRETTLDAFAHLDLPFEQLVQVLAPPRDLSRNPVIQVWFQLFEAESLDRFELPGIAVSEFLDQDTATTTRFDLELQLKIGADGGLDGQVIYATDLFDGAMIRRFAEHYTNLLASVAADPQCRVDRLAVSSPEERDQVVRRWNAAGVCDSGPEPGVLDRFGDHARHTPDAVALVDGARRWSYAQLADRARGMAGALAVRRIGRGSRVALCLRRTADLPAAMLAVAKAGAAAVPLDPGWPVDELRSLVTDIAADLVVVDQLSTMDLGAPTATVAELAAPQWSTDEPVTVGPADALWVTYRPGRAGQSTAVLVEHGAVARLVSWAAQRCDSPPVTSLYSPTTSEVFGYELWSTWWAGGAAVVVADAERDDAVVLADLIDRHRVDTVLVWQPVFDQLAAQCDRLRGVRRFVVRSRSAHADAMQELANRAHPAQVYRDWGCAEVTVATACRLHPPAEGAPPATVIGAPAATARVYVLDAHLEPVPVNVPGDLYVGGGALARGYPGHPDDTAGAFLPDPFGEAVGARMYRTRERARWRTDGTVEHLGRVDHQFTIRGYRVEPEEVEAALREHPAIADAAVTAHHAANGTRLAAHIVPAPGQTVPEPAPLQDWLREWLPDYLVPHVFVVLDRLPTTATGELDRPALPTPDLRVVHAPPRDDIDREILALWCELLGRGDIGINDNFFELGGHSLLIPQVVHRVNKGFGTALPMRALFRSQTVMTLADEVRVSLAKRVDSLATANSTSDT